MRTLVIAGSLLVGSTALSVQDPAQPARHADSRVAQLYTENCASCHVPPDSRFAVDRAWIAQLADTA